MGLDHCHFFRFHREVAFSAYATGPYIMQYMAREPKLLGPPMDAMFTAETNGAGEFWVCCLVLTAGFHTRFHPGRFKTERAGSS